MDIRSERILLTGKSGFTGRRLAQRLEARGLEVMGLECDGCALDVRERLKLGQAIEKARPDVVVHLAGIASNLHPDIGEIYAINVAGTANLLDALASLSKKPRLVILASSATVYAPSPDGKALTEESAVSPANHYALSKHQMEQVAAFYMHRLPILVTRPFNYTGPDQSSDFVLAKIAQHFKSRAKEINLGNIDISRDFSDVEAVSDIYEALILQGKPGHVVNISSGFAVSLREIIEIFTVLTGHEIKIIHDPRFFRSGEPQCIFGSKEKLESWIGPIPSRPLTAMLKSMLA